MSDNLFMSNLFNKQITDTYKDKSGVEHTNTLTFIKSKNIQAYPCGRRRSTSITNSKGSVTQDYFIPFDPEARLNTEQNNRRYASVNGYAQSYVLGIDQIDQDKATLSFTISGYNFIITNFTDLNTFCTELASSLNIREAVDKIYANIKLAEIPLYYKEGLINYKTWVLRNQSATVDAANELDLFAEGTKATDDNKASKQNRAIQDADDYYFSGLAFSYKPITIESLESTDKIPVFSSNYIAGSTDTQAEQDFSLCIFEKIGDTWTICEEAKLPNIRHGDTEDSVEVGHLYAQSIYYYKEVSENPEEPPVAVPVAVFDLEEVEESGESFYKLKLTDTSRKDLD